MPLRVPVTGTYTCDPGHLATGALGIGNASAQERIEKPGRSMATGPRRRGTLRLPSDIKPGGETMKKQLKGFTLIELMIVVDRKSVV